MSSTPPTGGRLLIEPLEARIAPTGLTAISNNTASSSDPTYVTYTTQPTADHLGFVPASNYLGASAPANTYAIKLTGDGSINAAGLPNGDKLLVFNLTTGFNPTSPFLQATNKTILGFFQDVNGDNQVQANELVGLSLAKKASASVNGNVNGDIVTNLSVPKDGSAITVNLSGVGNAKTSIAGLSINGNVTGSILAGGDITAVSIVGNANNIFAGTATNGSTYHFSGVDGNGNQNAATGTIAAGAFPDLLTGASINGLSVTALNNGAKIFAGTGGRGGFGGSINGLTVLSETAGFIAQAGDGGVGSDTIRGGTGGDILNSTIVGATGTASGALITLHAGNGGANDAFKAGAGGAITGVGTNFNTFDGNTNTGAISADFLLQHLLVQAGDGGTGLKGGRGGNVTSSSIFSASPDDGVVNNGVANPEIQVLGGHGGLASFADRGKGGAGGSVSQVFAQDFNADILNADLTTTPVTDSVLVQAGDGGAGRDGGSLEQVGILGAQIIANAGNGADGINKGGIGGSVNTLNILNQNNLLAHQLTVNAGSGGAASNGPGGAGGNISLVNVLDSDLNLLVINGGTHANGGVGNRGLGGAGGLVTNVQINDNDMSGALATVTVRAGAGGDGLTGGGNGGDIGNASSPVQMFGLNYRVTATAGAGGNVITGRDGSGGSGGNGGSLDTVGFSSVPAVNQIEVGNAIESITGLSNYTQLTGTATAGAGGTGTVNGGVGGSLSGVNLRTGFDIFFQAGAGGGGGSGLGGDGGSIVSSAGVSLGGAVNALAGNAAGAGSFAANGGRIQAVIASAQSAITMLGGAGGIGGAGGDIINSGTTVNPLYVDPTFDAINGVFFEQTVSNFGNVMIKAGSGSSANGVAGQGGSVTNFTGAIGLGGAGNLSNAIAHNTVIVAGAGGGGDGQTASGAGGSVTGLKLTGNVLQDSFGGQNVTVDAGDAGQASAAKNGAAGGQVNTVTIYNLDPGTVVQHLAAGDGSSAAKKGGAGGSLTEIHVGQPGDTIADIGVRSGVAYGYALGSAGGLFAGVGGTGKKLTGLNGDVTRITANAISSIVAGKTGTVHLANLVDNIKLAGNGQSDRNGAVNADGSYNNFDLLNVVGSVQNPALAGDANNSGAGGASTYHAGDGLVAALNLTQDRNFFPEAFLTADGSGTLVFTDYQQPKATPVTTTTIPFSASL